jgi:hypothetical protein
MEAKEYFEKEYGHEHIEMVTEMKDWVSLYGLMDEFAEWKVKNCSIPAVISSVCTCRNAELEKDSLVPVYCHNCNAYVQTDIQHKSNKTF